MRPRKRTDRSQNNRHLCFDHELPLSYLTMSLSVQTNFPGANACAIDIQSTPDRDLVYFAADPHHGTEALWFYFRVVECSTRPVELVLTNLDTCLGGGGAHWERVRPVVRQADSPWERLPNAKVDTLADGRRQAAWTVVPRYDSFEFALCYPYGLGDLEMTRAASGDYWRLDLIGVTAGGQPLPRLSNTTIETQAPGLYLVARQHAGETPGSWVLDGLLRRAAQVLDPSALPIWTVPLAHLDGVVAGDYGKDPFPWDLNRAWTTPPMRHEVRVIQSDIARWAARTAPALAIDFHAPSPTETAGAFFFLPRQERPRESLAAAQQAIDAITPALPKALLRTPPARQIDYPSRWDATATLDAHIWDRYQIPCLAMEIPYASSHTTLLTRSQYHRLGAALLEAICAHLQVELA